MSRLDQVIADLTSSRSSRRKLLERAAALGLTVPALSIASRGVLVARADVASGEVRWVSPRGTIEVLDDYPLWVAQKMGYFGDLTTTIEPAILEATSSAKAIADGQADMSFLSPGVFTGSLDAGIDLVSVFQTVGVDPFDIALPKGNPGGITRAKDLEGKTMLLGDIGWTLIVDPMIVQDGGDPSLVNYQATGGQGWGQALEAGQGDASLAWPGLRAQWKAGGLEFDYILGSSWSKFPGNSYQIRRSDVEDPALTDVYTKYLQGVAMGLEFGYQNPRAATEITMNSEPIATALNQTFPNKQDALDSMWELAVAFRGDFTNRNGGMWGWHDQPGWQDYLDITHDLGQMQNTAEATDVARNVWIEGANGFDKAKVKADAEAYELSADYAALPVPEGAGA